MKLDHAIKVVKSLQRYRYREGPATHPRGAYLRSVLPLTTYAEFKLALEAQQPAMGVKVWVDLDHLKSNQTCLSRRRFLRQLRVYPNSKLPIIVQIAPRKYVIWDGNHRVMSALLLGKRRVRCLLVGRIRKVRK